jgi:hypothetical protein
MMGARHGQKNGDVDVAGLDERGIDRGISWRGSGRRVRNGNGHKFTHHNFHVVGEASRDRRRKMYRLPRVHILYASPIACN